jgi:hypothetical protein
VIRLEGVDDVPEEAPAPSSAAAVAGGDSATPTTSTQP